MKINDNLIMLSEIKGTLSSIDKLLKGIIQSIYHVRFGVDGMMGQLKDAEKIKKKGTRDGINND